MVCTKSRSFQSHDKLIWTLYYCFKWVKWLDDLILSFYVDDVFELLFYVVHVSILSFCVGHVSILSTSVAHVSFLSNTYYFYVRLIHEAAVNVDYCLYYT